MAAISIIIISNNVANHQKREGVSGGS